MRGKRFAAFFLCMMMLLLAACGKGEENGVREGNVALQERINSELLYFASDLELGLTGTKDVDFKAYGENVFYPQGQDIVTYSCGDAQRSVDSFKWESTPGEWQFERVSYGKSGEVFAVVSVSTASGYTYYLCRFDIERNLVFADDLTGYYQEAGTSLSGECKLEVGDDGNVYLSYPAGVWIFGGDGSYKDKVSFGDVKDVWVRDLQSDGDKNLYVLYEDKESNAQYVAQIDLEKSVVTANQKTIGLTGIQAYEDAMLCSGIAGTYVYDREEMTLTELFTWVECNKTGVSMYAARRMSDGTVFIAGNTTWDSVECFLVKSTQVGTPEASETGKTDIRLAVFVKPSAELNLAVSTFNKNNEVYQIVIESYGKEDREEGIAKLHAEIAAGQCPDLVDMRFGIGKSYVEDGYFEDLSLYLQGSDEINEGDFFEFALEEYNMDGILVAIPHHFAMQSMIGNSDLVGEEPGWTMDEMLTFLESQGDASVFASVYDSDLRALLFTMMRLNDDFFVDRDACTCNFDNEIFRRIVELGVNYPTEVERGEGTPSEYSNLQNGNGVLDTIALHDFMGLQVYDYLLGEALTCVGYPAEEGIGVWASSLDAFAMSALSENKDGAWEFMEYFLKWMKSDARLTTYPTYRPNAEKLAEKSLGINNPGKMMSSIDNFVFEYHTPTQEEVEVYLTLMENARPGCTDVGLMDILEEELISYYAGEKTMDELIEQVESRVQIYLQENR